MDNPSVLPTYLRKESSRYKLEKAKARSAQQAEYVSGAARQDAEAYIERFYGTADAYEETKQRLAMTAEHARCFEYYGVILQPKQIEFAVLARAARELDGPNEIGFGGARGPGKSFAVFAVLSLDDCMNFPGLKALYLRKTGRKAKEQLEDVARTVLRHVPDADVKRERVDFANGSHIVIGGFNDDRQAQAYQGIEHDVLAIEEATQLTKRTHEALHLSRRSSKVFGGKPWRPHDYYTTNPLGIGHAYFKKRFVDNERRRERGEAYDSRRRFLFGTVEDNLAVNVEYVGVLDELVGVEYRAYRLGDWEVSAGAYFEEWNERIHVIAPIDDVSWMRELWCSMDFGFNHWNVVYLHGKDGDGITYTLDELCHRKRTPEEIGPDIMVWLAQYGLSRDDLDYFLVGSDAFAETGRAKTTVAQQYSAQGIYMSRAETSPGSRVAGALHMAKLLGSRERRIDPKWYVTSRCKRLRECLPYLERDPHNAEDVLKVNADEHGGGGDDPYDGARYGIWKPHVTIIS